VLLVPSGVNFKILPVPLDLSETNRLPALSIAGPAELTSLVLPSFVVIVVKNALFCPSGANFRIDPVLSLP
jgi:hypothetical protein